MAKRLDAARAAFVEVVDFVAGHSKASPNAVYAGSVPYLMLAGNLMAGWQMGRSLLVAQAQLAADVDQDFMQAKISTARFYADATAATLAGLGFNVNFAPCVDLAINPENNAIVKPERAYSKNPDSVVYFAREVIRQHRKHNILTSPKHFPGHGSSTADTHFGIADVTETWSEQELKPYKDLLAGNYADAIMTSHIVNKNLDPSGLPGTLSKRVIDSLLRKKMGFNGLIFTDDMQMHAITKHFGLEEAIRLAILAGVDVMCFSNNIQGSEERTADKVHRIILDFVRKGQISPERIDQSYRRIMAVKKKWLDADTIRMDFKAMPKTSGKKR
jgi:beta-N-acetylhexosaminidase